MTGANTYFGFFNTDGSVIGYDYMGDGTDATPGDGTVLIAGDVGLGGSITVQNTSYDQDRQNDLNNRVYSLDATATLAPTPEPNSLVLLGTGLLGVCGMARRRFLKA